MLIGIPNSHAIPNVPDMYTQGYIQIFPYSSPDVFFQPGIDNIITKFQLITERKTISTPLALHNCHLLCKLGTSLTRNILQIVVYIPI
jgi:hypothetical protein